MINIIAFIFLMSTIRTGLKNNIYKTIKMHVILYVAMLIALLNEIIAFDYLIKYINK